MWYSSAVAQAKALYKNGCADRAENPAARDSHSLATQRALSLSPLPYIVCVLRARGLNHYNWCTSRRMTNDALANHAHTLHSTRPKDAPFNAVCLTAVPIAQLLLQRQQRQRTAPSSQS
jgi:hypothetical protein